MGNIIVSEEQLARIVNQLKQQVNENHEQGSYMAKQQLFIIATLAYKMWENMPEGEQLEDWQESKIAQAEQSITAVVKSFAIFFSIKSQKFSLLPIVLKSSNPIISKIRYL